MGNLEGFIIKDKLNLDDITSIGQILIQNGWTLITGINAMIFSLLHWPCSTPKGFQPDARAMYPPC